MDKQPLLTAAAEACTDYPWQSYPRPQLQRESYVNLNGWWDFENTPTAQLPQTYSQKIRVPFCPESQLSGIGAHFDEGSSLFYRRSFTLDADFIRDRVLLHIGAADQITEIYVNQIYIGKHTGGYDSFCFDITHALREENELVIRVTDDLRSHVLPYGKQVLQPQGMWYTPVSGIWQTVWLESVPKCYVNHLDIQVSQAAATVTCQPPFDGTVTLEDGSTYPMEKGVCVIAPAKPHLWTPEDPYLYRFTLQTAQDQVRSYFALRTLEIRQVGKYPRLCLNGKPYFFHGLLDQGYWPDGLFTPAVPECYEQDILAMKTLGFNTLRKHIKVEPEQFYYDCDRLGMIVFQDMVNNGDYDFLRDTALPTIGLQKRKDTHLHQDEATRKAFLEGMEATVRQLRNHPCICYWTIFNEGWGQFAGSHAYATLLAQDSSRFIDTTSGWFRGAQTQVDSRHIYFGPWRLSAGKQPLVLSEFGGAVCAVEGHMQQTDKAYGYHTCTDLADFQSTVLSLYEKRILPRVSKGLCAAIYTQLSDVETEINGLMTYDRKVCKLAAQPMQDLAKRLQAAMK